MPSSDYRKWVLLAILIVVVGIIVFSYITSTSDRKEIQSQAVAKRPEVAAGPMIDAGTVPEQLQLDSLPEDPAYLASLGDKYFESKRFEQAIEIYKKAIELNPNDIDTINDLGLAYFYTKNTNEAISTLRKGTEVNPSFQRIWLSLGYVLMSAGKNEEARQALQKTVDLAPDSGVGQEARRMMGLLNNPG
jgi:tetratricopeptide (TPR) repeat protein